MAMLQKRKLQCYNCYIPQLPTTIIQTSMNLYMMNIPPWNQLNPATAHRVSSSRQRLSTSSQRKSSNIRPQSDSNVFDIPDKRRPMQKFYGRHHEQVDRYDVSIYIMKTNLFNVSKFSFPHNLPWLDYLLSFGDCLLQSRGRLPYRCTRPMLPVFIGVRVLLLCIILVILYSLPCVSVFCVWSLSLEYILLISARILIPFINHLGHLGPLQELHLRQHELTYSIENSTI